MTRAAIKHAESRLGEAIVKSDVELLDQLLSDRVLFCAPDGRILRKEDDLAAHRGGEHRIQRVTRYEASELTIELHEHTAVVSVRVAITGTYAGIVIDGAYRYTRTWVREGHGEGAWKVVLAHANVIATPDA